MDYKKFLCPEGAEALRTFAASMPIAIENIKMDTDALNMVYQSVADELGYHSDNFGEMILLIKDAQEKAADAIMELPKGLTQTAQKIDDWCAKNPHVLGK